MITPDTPPASGGEGAEPSGHRGSVPRSESELNPASSVGGRGAWEDLSPARCSGPQPLAGDCERWLHDFWVLRVLRQIARAN